MRSIIIVIIACFLFPVTSGVKAHSEAKEETTSEQQKPQTDGETDREKKQDTQALDFSGTGRPGQQTAGESRGSCLKDSQTIEAMLPISNSGNTVLGHPRFWVYFPESTAKTAETEFIIQDEARQDIWRSRSELKSANNYQSFSLPKTVAPLEVGQWYRWYVKVYCKGQVASVQYVQGWVKRLPLSSKLKDRLQQHPHQRHITYGKNNIWYDAIDQLMNQYHRHPHKISLEADWHHLTRAKGVDLTGLPSISGEQISQQKF